MNIRNLKRNADRVVATLQDLPDGTTITKEGCEIHIPCRYEEKTLAYIGQENQILSIFAMVLSDGSYGVFTAMTMVKIDPLSSRKVVIEGEDYYVFEFPKNSTVFKSKDVVIDKLLPYYVYDYFVDNARIPWYLNYEDLPKIFDTSVEYCGYRLGANRAVLPLMIAMTARSTKDKTVYYRQIVGKESADVAWVPFKSVLFGPKTTTAKLMGAYFDSGLTSALVNPNDRPENIETLLRQ